MNKRLSLTIPVGFGLKVTFDMRIFSLLFFAVAIFLYAGVSANESIYLLASSFICTAGLAFIMPLLVVLHVKGECVLPQDVLDEEASKILIKLRRKNVFGFFSLIIPTKQLRMTLDLVRRGLDGRPQGAVLSPEPVLIEKLTGENWFEFPTPDLRRGIYFLNSIEISTCFPFGLIWWTRRLQTGKVKELSTITVYPRTFTVSGNFLEHIRGIKSTMGLASSSSMITHQSTSFRSVREYRSGDSLRHIHWASTAKFGNLLVREFDQETIPVFDLVLNLRANWKTPEQFELAVSAIMSLCHLGYNKGQLPNLTIYPPVDSPALEKMMQDLPENLGHGIGRYAEILARVEPVRQSLDPDEQNFDSQSVYLEREVLTFVPTNDRVMKFSPEKKADVICTPIDLSIVEPEIAYEGAQTKSKRAGAATASNPEPSFEGKVIARLDWELDMEGL
ncbi:MAG: DUF58 domain-containing protein [Candidatus Melainabacteria bacterium]|nr:DUF58 domain-containing protein [Candidatus Melainabacteria bacterium]